MFYEVLMEKRALINALKQGVMHTANAVASNPYAVTGAVAGGVGGAVASGEGKRLKGALGGAVIGGVAGKGLQAGIGHFDKGELGGKIRDLAEGSKDVGAAITTQKQPYTLGDGFKGLRDLYGDSWGKMGIGGPQMLGTAAVTGGIAGAGAMRVARQDRARQEADPSPRKGNPLLGVGGYLQGIKR
jgi:hypothetical protein